MTLTSVEARAKKRRSFGSIDFSEAGATSRSSSKQKEHNRSCSLSFGFGLFENNVLRWWPSWDTPCRAIPITLFIQYNNGFKTHPNLVDLYHEVMKHEPCMFLSLKGPAFKFVTVDRFQHSKYEEGVYEVVEHVFQECYLLTLRLPALAKRFPETKRIHLWIKRA